MNPINECPQRTAGHCWHLVVTGSEEYEACCVCPARRNERVLGVQEAML